MLLSSSARRRGVYRLVCVHFFVFLHFMKSARVSLGGPLIGTTDVIPMAISSFVAQMVLFTPHLTKRVGPGFARVVQSILDQLGDMPARERRRWEIIANDDTVFTLRFTLRLSNRRTVTDIRTITPS